jgi:hypothetical protein
MALGRYIKLSILVLHSALRMARCNLKRKQMFGCRLVTKERCATAVDFQRGGSTGVPSGIRGERLLGIETIMGLQRVK